MGERRKVTVSFNTEQYNDLEALMKEDGQTNYTFYVVYLVQQEKKRRLESKDKRPVGRPKKVEEEELFYPAPYENGGVYTRADLEGYYAFRNLPMPDPMPIPLTKEELQKRGY